MTHQSERVLTRGVRLEQERAIGGARNPGDSKYGSTLYKINSTSNRRFAADLSTIEKQLKRSNMHIDQEKRQFLLKHTGSKPLLIVHRPPSPVMKTKHKAQQYEDHEYHSHTYPEKGPRYMKPLRSKAKVVNLRPTIDAFCVKTKKKVNLWESPMLEKEKPSFKSTVMPSWPLLASEVDDLVEGMEQHKALATHEEQSKALVVLEEKKTKKKSKKRSPKYIEWKTPPTTTSTTDCHITEESPKDNPSEWHFVTEAPISTFVAEDTEPQTSYPKPKREVPRDSALETSQKLESRQDVVTDKSHKQSKPKARSSGVERSKDRKTSVRHGDIGQTSELKQNAICYTHPGTPEHNGTYADQDVKVIGARTQQPEQPMVSGEQHTSTDYETADTGRVHEDMSGVDRKAETKGGSTNNDHTDISREQNITSPSGSPNRHVSGLEIILEAAIEGLN